MVESSLAGHLGTRKMLEKVQRRFYWVNSWGHMEPTL